MGRDPGGRKAVTSGAVGASVARRGTELGVYFAPGRADDGQPWARVGLLSSLLVLTALVIASLAFLFAATPFPNFVVRSHLARIGRWFSSSLHHCLRAPLTVLGAQSARGVGAANEHIRHHSCTPAI